MSATVALVVDDGGLQADDLLMDRFDPVTIPDETFELISEVGSTEEKTAAGWAAWLTYSSNEWAERLLTAAMEAGDVSAFNGLGALRLEQVPADWEGARRWMYRGAQEGDPFAMINLGNMALEYIPDGWDVACAMFDSAAKTGHAVGMLYYGRFLITTGDEALRREGWGWLQQAAAAGNNTAQRALAGRPPEPPLPG